MLVSTCVLQGILVKVVACFFFPLFFIFVFFLGVFRVWLPQPTDCGLFIYNIFHFCVRTLTCLFVCLFARSVISVRSFLIRFVGHCVFMLKCQQKRKDCDRLAHSLSLLRLYVGDYLFILFSLFSFLFFMKFYCISCCTYLLCFSCSLFKVIWILTSCFAKSANKIDKDLLVFYRENIIWNFHK